MYVKLFTQILDSSIADDRKLRHFFTDLLLCADAKGLVMMTKNALARKIGCDISEVEWGLELLSRPDPGSKTPDNEGRRVVALEGSGYGWLILNYEHYRAMKDADQLRESTKERVRRFREKKKLETLGSDTETLSNGGNANTASSVSASPSSFDLPLGENPKRTLFKPPTPEEVTAYSAEISYPLDGQEWCDSYQAVGWMAGKNKMKDWKCTVRNWKARGWSIKKPQIGAGGKKFADIPNPESWELKS